jgi:hypothetical protein
VVVVGVIVVRGVVAFIVVVFVVVAGNAAALDTKEEQKLRRGATLLQVQPRTLSTSLSLH